MSELWTPYLTPISARPGPDFPDVVPLADGRVLRFRDWQMVGPGVTGKRYFGPQKLIVLVSRDPTERFGELLHVSLSVGRHYPDWDTIVLVKRAFFGDDTDAMLPIPREADYIHNNSPGGQREVFQIIEMPQPWRRVW